MYRYCHIQTNNIMICTDIVTVRPIISLYVPILSQSELWLPGYVPCWVLYPKKHDISIIVRNMTQPNYPSKPPPPWSDSDMYQESSRGWWKVISPALCLVDPAQSDTITIINGLMWQQDNQDVSTYTTQCLLKIMSTRLTWPSVF